MSTSAQLGQFLQSRRARVRPEDHGLPDFSRRRVPGLRREELAQLAGVSVSYYTRIEQGHTAGASRAVLGALARVLGLTPDEHAHLLRLAADDHPVTRQSAPERIRPPLRCLVEVMDVPAMVVGRGMDVLAWNTLGHALLFDQIPYDAPTRAESRPNWARMMFRSTRTRNLFVDWSCKRTDVVGYLRLQAARYPQDQRLAELVVELSRESDDFASLWARHDVRDERPSKVRLRHHRVGELTLYHETLRSPEAPDQVLATFHADPGSPDEAALESLRSTVAEPTPPRRPCSVGTAQRPERHATAGSVTLAWIPIPEGWQAAADAPIVHDG